MKGVWAVILVMLTVCATGKESYSILNLETGKKASVKKVTPFRDVIIGQDAEAKTIRLFTRTKDKQFEIRDVHYDGSVARVASVPCFSAAHLETYALNMRGLAVSEDLSRIAYFDEGTKELRLFNKTQRLHELLLTNVAPSLYSVRLLRWRSENELIACVHEWGMPAARCFMLNVKNRSLVFDFHPVDSNCYSLSPNRRFLVYLDSVSKGSREHVYRIYDIELLHEIGTITSPDGFLSGFPCWTGASDGVFYNHHNFLMLYSLAKEKSKCLKECERGMVMSPLTSAGKRVFCVARPESERGSIHGVHVYDLDEHKELRFDRVKNNGEVIASPDGEFLITGWGL